MTDYVRVERGLLEQAIRQIGACGFSCQSDNMYERLHAALGEKPGEANDDMIGADIRPTGEPSRAALMELFEARTTAVTPCGAESCPCGAGPLHTRGGRGKA